MKNNEILRNAALDGLMQTREWDEICEKDPKLTKTTSDFHNMMDVIRGHSYELADKIENCALLMTAAYIDRAALYGMRIMAALLFAEQS